MLSNYRPISLTNKIEGNGKIGIEQRNNSETNLYFLYHFYKWMPSGERIEIDGNACY